MPTNLKFPSSVEIKRVIAATARAGIEIGSIEIQTRKIIIRPREKNETGVGDYDIWKMHEGRNTDRFRHADEESDAPSGKSKA